MTRKIEAALALALLTAGCSSGSSHLATAPQTPAPATPAPSRDIRALTPTTLASRLACTQRIAGDEDETFTRSEVSCQLNHGKVEIFGFTNSALQQRWLEVATQMGQGVLVSGDRWVVQVLDGDTEAIAKTVQSRVGGTVL